MNDFGGGRRLAESSEGVMGGVDNDADGGSTKRGATREPSDEDGAVHDFGGGRRLTELRESGGCGSGFGATATMLGKGASLAVGASGAGIQIFCAGRAVSFSPDTML